MVNKMSTNTASQVAAKSSRELSLEQKSVVSVIIPVLNEEKVIGRCLESLLQVDFPRDQFEVIVVDNGSTDSTTRVVHQFAPSLNLRLLERKGVCIAALRNLGASHAHSQIFAFLDADCLVPREWLSLAAALFQAHPAGVIGGHCRIPDKSSWVARTWYPEERISKRGVVRYVPSGDLLVSRSQFSSVGGFDETLETNEDYEFCQRISKAGFPVLAFPELNVVHLGVPQTVSEFYRRNRWHGKHVVKVFLRDISSLHNVKPILFALYVLLSLVGVVLGVVFGAFGRLELFAASLFATFLGPFVLALHAAVSRRRLSSLIPLTALFMLYGLARARCLVGKASSFRWR
jgi:glycosyltransferase involved in cell wall biosynthesis